MVFFRKTIKNSRFISTLYYNAKNKIELKKNYSVHGLNNTIINKGYIKDILFDIKGNNNSVEINQGAIAKNIKIFIRGDNHHFILSENTRFLKGVAWFEDNDCTIFIGKNTTIESAHLAVTEPSAKIIIEEDCMLSEDIIFRTGDSHSIIDLQSGKRINHAENINVRKHVWIGSGATILKGVTINENAIIAHGAIVTSDIPSNSIAAGIPAKVIKTGVTWLRERI